MSRIEPHDAARRARPWRRLALASAALLAACASPPPIETVALLDLPRFMGDWYVQAHVPAGVEAEACNAVESYALDDRGRVLTTYAFRDGGFDGAVEVLEPVGIVRSESGAVWGMRFWWPFEAEYVVCHVDAAYTETIIGRRKRDYAWIMTRAPEVEPARLEALVERVVALGYERDRVRVVPQRWPDPGHPASEAAGDLARSTRR